MAANPPSTKEREYAAWATVAPGWAKHDERLRQATGGVTERMLDAVGLKAGQRVLDIACGTGEPAIPAAERVGPTGAVLATDFVEDMLAFARQKAARKGLRNIEFRRMDGEELDLPANTMDAALIRWGLMFMPDAVGCLKRVHAALRSGGRIAIACWAAPEKNVWASFPRTVVAKYIDVPTPPADAPGAFAFSDPDRLRSTLAAAGFKNIAVDEVPLVLGGEFDTGAQFFGMVLEISGPMARAFAMLNSDQRKLATAEIIAEMEKYRQGGKVAVPGVTWLAHAKK